ncbi:uncharacterized protein L203_104050 [Cryptococcus depauperatus CBS 7841]|uniref:ER membrane protein complex subunit 1 n=1 Tax=Cryptococcus depauperatus CBS 7841 TaxID=1295531 RepID=A0A1E3IE21_9TREE|nr:endoplasmic reticulum protein [Cryptococcus depauperatus CBS 7841]
MNLHSRGKIFSTAILLWLLSALIPAVFALQKELAGIVDWHKPLVGEPILEPTPPLFVEDSGRRRLVQITKKNILAVLNADTGELVWRQKLEAVDPVVSFHVQNDSVFLLSGPGASNARLLSLSTGYVLWEGSLLDYQEAKLTTPYHLGTDAAYLPAQGSEPASWVVLCDGKRVTRLRHDDGSVVWSLELPAAASNMVFKQIMPSGSSIHLLALHYSFAVQSLLTSTISLDKPILKADFGQIPSLIQVPEQALLASSSERGSASAVWIEHGRIRTVLIKENGQLGKVKDLLPDRGKLYSEILDVGLRHKGIVLGKREDGGVEVLDVKRGRKVEEFELSKDSPDRSESIYSGVAIDKGVIVNRVYWSFVMGVGVAQTIDIPNSASDDVITSGFTFAYDDLSHGVLIHAAVSPSLDNKHLPTLILFTSSSAVQHMTHNTSIWTREEGLADIVGVQFVELGEPDVEEVRDILVEESFFGRVTRHITELKDFPAYLYRFIKRFTTASYTSTLLMKPLNSTHLHRDQFGFQKLLILSTGKGKLYALDSVNGRIIWTRNLGLLNKGRPEISLEGIWTVKGSETEGPRLAIVGVKSVGEKVETLAWHVEAYTGKVIGDISRRTGLPLGTTLFEGRVKDAFLLPYRNCDSKTQVVAVVDDQNQAHIWPSCRKVTKELTENSDKIFFAAPSSTIDSITFQGFTLSPMAGNGKTFSANLLWSLPFHEKETVLDVQPVKLDAIASFGRVLGDKSTLYKYINPHLLIISTFTAPEPHLSLIDHIVPGQGRIYVLDTVSGSIIWSTIIEGLGDGQLIKVGMVENWLVYTWLDGERWRLGSVEIYEDTGERKGVTPSMTSFQKQRVKTFAQTFILPTDVQTIGFTTSKAGITTKELVVVNSRNQIFSLPRRLLDPRRPVGKPSSRDREEMLIPYDPLLPFDPTRVISHEYELQGVTNLYTSSSLLESTSLLFACGQDLFLTRGLAPSGSFDILSDNFNKAQLLLTLGALSVGISLARPAVRTKMLRMRWF